MSHKKISDSLSSISDAAYAGHLAAQAGYYFYPDPSLAVASGALKTVDKTAKYAKGITDRFGPYVDSWMSYPANRDKSRVLSQDLFNTMRKTSYRPRRYKYKTRNRPSYLRRPRYYYKRRPAKWRWNPRRKYKRLYF